MVPCRDRGFKLRRAWIREDVPSHRSHKMCEDLNEGGKVVSLTEKSCVRGDFIDLLC